MDSVDAVTQLALELSAVNARLDRQERLLEKLLKVLGGGSDEEEPQTAGGDGGDEEPQTAGGDGGDEEPQTAGGDGGDEEPQTQTAAGGDDPPAGDWPAGVDESHRISPSCLGVLVGASLARKALQAAGEQLEREGMPKAEAELLFSAGDLLQPPLEAIKIAAAYDLVREVLKKYSSPGNGQDLTYKAGLATREVLVLQVSENVDV